MNSRPKTSFNQYRYQLSKFLEFFADERNILRTEETKLSPQEPCAEMCQKCIRFAPNFKHKIFSSSFFIIFTLIYDIHRALTFSVQRLGCDATSENLQQKKNIGGLVNCYRMREKTKDQILLSAKNVSTRFFIFVWVRFSEEGAPRAKSSFEWLDW